MVEYLVSSREPERVAPAQPDPMIIMDCFDEDIAKRDEEDGRRRLEAM